MASAENNGLVLLDYEPIDKDHGEFLALLSQANAAGNTGFPALFQQLYERTERHFDRENQLMKELSFPAEAEHKGEHQRVLGEFKQFKTRVDKGLIAFGRPFVKERLPQWFYLHAATMDSALAAHLKARRSA